MKKDKVKLKNYPLHVRIILISAYVCFALFLLLLILCFALANVYEGYTTLGILSVVFLFVGIGAMFLGFNLGLKTCGYCGKSLKGCEYSYIEQSRNVITTNTSKPYVKYTFEISAVCPHCGKVTKHTKTIEVRNGENAEYKIQNFCNKKFR